MISRRTFTLTLLAMLATATSCEPPAERQGPVRRAQLGLFFGGQVQERDEIPFTLDRSKQTQGFRIDFAAPLAAPLDIRWEIDRPKIRGNGRVAELGAGQARVGQERFDHELPFEPGHPLGTWNVRVIAGEQIVIDRPVLVYDARARRRALKDREASLSKGAGR